MSQQKALFLDRDGVVNVDHGYVSKPEQFEFIDGVFEATKWFEQQGYAIVIVTNQSGIGRGYYDEAAFNALTQWMIGEFANHGVTIADVQFCPHHPTNAQAEYLLKCTCRKPEPGMLLAAQKKLNIDMAQSIMVGDKVSDMKAARSANVQFKYLVESGQTLSDQDKAYADGTFADLLSVKNDWMTR